MLKVCHAESLSRSKPTTVVANLGMQLQLCPGLDATRRMSLLVALLHPAIVQKCALTFRTGSSRTLYLVLWP